MVATLSSNYLGYFNSKYTAREIEDAIDSVKRRPTSNRCENCGAPLNEYGGCDYCGTGKQSKQEKAETRYKYQLMGRDVVDGDAVVYFQGSLYRCHVVKAEAVQYDGGGGRTQDGTLYRNEPIVKRWFQVVQE